MAESFGIGFVIGASLSSSLKIDFGRMSYATQNPHKQKAWFLFVRAARQTISYSL